MMYHPASLPSRKDPLGTRHARARISRHSCTQRHRQRFEGALGTVVVVIAPQAVNVQRNARRLREALEHMGAHLGRKLGRGGAVQAVDW